MPQSESLAGRRILVTGATSGLGAALAYSLAVDHGAHVIATGRRQERLADLAERVSAAHATSPSCAGYDAGADGSSERQGIETHRLDLTDRNAVQQFCSMLRAQGVDDLILNAGVTNAEEFVNGSIDDDLALVETNVNANLQLVRSLVEPLATGGTGSRILLVASLGGLLPLPYQAVYAGSKAFLINFGLSLREELKSHGICVLVFAPGGVATEMTDIDAMSALQDQLANVNDVANDAIRLFLTRRALVIPGWQNKLLALLSRLLPHTVVASLSERIYRAGHR